MMMKGREMNGESYYLKPNVQVEPLFDQWYAWPHLIPPATAARNVTERHLKIMDSYVNAPQVHASAVQNPKMLGGPFMDYGGGRVDEVKALRERTKRNGESLLKLSAAIGELDQFLHSTARGYSLQPLYEKVPELLRGYVELVYDLNNNPSFRLFEPLLYRSKYYDRSLQSLKLSLTGTDERPFVMSTPRLESDESMHWQIPFDDERIDRLFKMKSEPQPWTTIKDLMSGAAASESTLRSLFTAEAPPRYQPYEGKGVRWRYFGHACLLIEAGGLSLMCDPVLSYTYDTELFRYTYRDLPDQIDYVLITHCHTDHILFETMLQLRHKIKNIIIPKGGDGALQDPSLKLILKNIGFKNVYELDELGSIATDRISLLGIPFLGEHCDLNVKTKLAYLVRIGRHSFLIAADSCNIEPKMYDYVHDEAGDVDAIFLGMECDGAPLSWMYGPLLTKRLERQMDESRRLAGSDFEQAIKIVDRFKCREVYVYAMGQEPWLNYVMSLKYTEQSRPIIESNKLIKECQRRGIYAERLYGEKEILLD